MIVLKAPEDYAATAFKVLKGVIERTCASPFFRIFHRATTPVNLLVAERARMLSSLIARIDYRTLSSRRMAVQTGAASCGFFSAGKVDARNAP